MWSERENSQLESGAVKVSEICQRHSGHSGMGLVVKNNYPSLLLSPMLSKPFLDIFLVKFNELIKF